MRRFDSPLPPDILQWLYALHGSAPRPAGKSSQTFPAARLLPPLALQLHRRAPPLPRQKAVSPPHQTSLPPRALQLPYTLIQAHLHDRGGYQTRESISDLLASPAGPLHLTKTQAIC